MLHRSAATVALEILVSSRFATVVHAYRTPWDMLELLCKHIVNSNNKRHFSGHF